MRIILYISFDKCFYNCDVVVKKYLYITFLIHKETVCIPGPCIMKHNESKFYINLGFSGTLSGCNGLLFCEVCFCGVLRHNGDS